MENLTEVQKQIVLALQALSGKDLITEANLCKKIRELAKINGKSKAGVGQKDLEKAVEFVAQENQIYFALHLNSNNEFMLKKDAEYKFLETEAHQRRTKSEKSMSIFTNADFSKASKSASGGKKKEKRHDRRAMNIYSNFEDE